MTAALLAAAHPTGALPPFAAHPGAWVAVLAALAAYLLLLRTPVGRVTRAQAWSFIGGIAVVVAAATWPLADLAAHRLLAALVVQRLLLMIATPPLLLRGLPRDAVRAATRPPLVDTVADVLSRPAVAVVVVTVVAVGTLSVPAVDAQASSVAARAGFDAALLLAGVVLWLPVLTPVPGTGRRTPLARAGYLVVQSIVPGFLSVVWIFARRPMYPAYVHRGTVWGLSPLVDQELSGFLAKLLTIASLWTVAFVIVLRSERVSEAGGDPEPLTWADVERQLERVARRERRGTGPPPETGPAEPRPRDRRKAPRDGPAGGPGPCGG